MLKKKKAPGQTAARKASAQVTTRHKELVDELRIKNIVFETSAAANSTADDQGNINHVNAAFLRLWGYRTEEEAVGKSVASFFANDKDALPVMESLNTTGQWEGEFLAKRADGTTFITRGLAIVIRDERGKQIGYHSSNIDVTGERRAQEELREKNEEMEAANQELSAANEELTASEEELKAAEEELHQQMAELERKHQALNESESKFKRLYDSNIIGVIFWDTAGNITKANSEFLRIVGYTEDDVLSGKARWKDMTPSEYAPLDEKALREMAETGVSAPFEKEYIRKDGSRVPVVIGATIFKRQTDFGICFVLDITERKRAEEEIQAKNLELLNTKSQLGEALQTSEKSRLALLSVLEDEKQAEQALKAKEEQYRTLVEGMNEGLIQVDNNDVITFVNQRFCQISGYPRGELVGKVGNELLFDQADRDVIRRKNQDRLGGKSDSYEVKLRCQDGQERWVYVSGTPVIGHNGAVTGSIGTFTDITERKRAEEKLRESELNYRTLADSGQALVWTAGTDKLCNYFNKVWLEFTGRPLEQELGNGWAEGVHPDDLQRCLDIYTGAFDRRENFSMDYRLRRYDGEYRWIRDDGSPRYNSDGEFVGYIGHCLDITQHKLTEQALEAERRQLLSIFGGMSEIVYIADPDTYQLLYTNEAFKKALGDRIGEKCHKAIQNKAAPCTFCTNQHIFGPHAGETYVWEFQNQINKLWYRCVDRAIRWSDGRMVRFEMAIDITDSKKAQENTLASLKEKEVMLKEIHHRVKNNLQIIASLLNLQTGYVKDERYKKMFLESQARVRAMALVHEKLYKSKDLGRIDFAEYVSSLIEEQYQAYGVDPERVSLEINISEKHLPLDTAIPCGLLINELVSNSLKYAFKNREGRGKVKITLHKNKDGEYQLEVGDNGTGLSDDFDIKSTSTLGLQLVDALVEQLVGKLKVSKSPGARFVITFKT